MRTSDAIYVIPALHESRPMRSRAALKASACHDAAKQTGSRDEPNDKASECEGTESSRDVTTEDERHPTCPFGAEDQFRPRKQVSSEHKVRQTSKRCESEFTNTNDERSRPIPMQNPLPNSKTRVNQSE